MVRVYRVSGSGFTFGVKFTVVIVPMVSTDWHAY